VLLIGCADTSQLRQQAESGDTNVIERIEDIEKTQVSQANTTLILFSVVMGVLTALVT